VPHPERTKMDSKNKKKPSPHSGDPPLSGSATAQPTDDVSANSMNITQNINGVMDPGSHNTVDEEGCPSYAGDSTRKAALGEHRADSAVISCQPSRTREPRAEAHRPTIDPPAISGSPQTTRTARRRDANKPDPLSGGGPVSPCSDSLLSSHRTASIKLSPFIEASEWALTGTPPVGSWSPLDDGTTGGTLHGDEHHTIRELSESR